MGVIVEKVWGEVSKICNSFPYYANLEVLGNVSQAKKIKFMLGLFLGPHP